MNILALIPIWFLMYLCGSIPFGLIISKLASGIDIREHGSHNIGSTNVARTLGKKWGAVVLLLDGLKALIPLLIVRHIYNSQFIMATSVIAVVLGHIFPVWLKFKGGKGIACILFSLFVVDYRIGALFLATWILMFLVFRISALSALTAVVVSTIAFIFVSKTYFFMMLFLGVLTFYKHRSNIQRMLNGEELGFNSKK